MGHIAEHAFLVTLYAPQEIPAYTRLTCYLEDTIINNKYQLFSVTENGEQDEKLSVNFSLKWPSPSAIGAKLDMRNKSCRRLGGGNIPGRGSSHCKGL